MNELTQEELKKRLRYDPITGVFLWLKQVSNRVKSGGLAGGYKKVGGSTYMCVGVNGKQYLAHRLAWLYVCGEFPPDQIDHIDGNRLNNKIENLRAVTQQENLKNKKMPSNNISGGMGVSWDKRANKWLAQIQCNSEKIYLGRYINFNDAVIARKMAENKYGFHENHGRREL